MVVRLIPLVTILILPVAGALSSQVAAPWDIETALTGPNVGWDSSLAIDSNGKAHISSLDAANLYLKYSTDASGSWVTTTVDDDVEVGYYTAIGVDSLGKAHIAYLDYTNTALRYATNASGSWQITTLDDSGYVGEHVSLAVDHADKVHISYRDFTGRGLKYATNASGPWSAVTLWSDLFEAPGIYTDIAVDSGNHAHICFSDTLYNLNYATNAGGPWSRAIVDSTDLVGEHCSIAVDTAGKAHIAYNYYVYNDCDLRYATNSGGPWSIATVDGAGNVGFFTSTAVDGNGKCHISYMTGASEVRYATNTSGTWSVGAVEAGVCMEETSIAIGPDDRPRVSYTGQNVLRYATRGDGGRPFVLSKGAIKDSARPLGDSIAATCASTDASVLPWDADPPGDGLRITVGGGAAPFVLDVGPGAPGWKSGAGKHTFKNAQCSLSLDTVRGVVKFKAKKLDLAGIQENPISVRMESGEFEVEDERAWTANPKAPGSFKFP